MRIVLFQKSVIWVFIMKLMKFLISDEKIDPNKPIRLIINIDQQSTKSNGYYNLHDGLIEELKYGIVNFNYSSLIKPIIYSDLDILISYQDSGKSYVVQAADLLAGTIRKKAIEELDGSRFIYCSSITKKSHKMAFSQLGRRTIQRV